MTLVNLAPLIRQQFNYNGAPLANGLLFTYAAGTTNKQATYTDSSGETPNTNPIVLDENGNCDLWLDITLTYKFVLSRPGDTDPPTNPIWTRDNISPRADAFGFDQDSVPTADIGDIWVNGIGACRWDSDDSKYYRIQSRSNRVLINTSTTWTPDAFTKNIFVEVQAGGGGGAYSDAATVVTGSHVTSGGGGGGGCGDYLAQDTTVTPGSGVAVIVGAGGTTGTSTTNATNGGSSSFGTLTANGGLGGIRAAARYGGAPGGQGATAGGNGISIANNVSAATAPGNGGTGGSTKFGAGGAGGASSKSAGSPGSPGNSADATAYGAGGGGGGGSYDVSTYASGSSGAPGVVIIWY